LAPDLGFDSVLVVTVSKKALPQLHSWLLKVASASGSWVVALFRQAARKRALFCSSFILQCNVVNFKYQRWVFAQ